jgi:DNA-binding NtrC family response regulator
MTSTPMISPDLPASTLASIPIDAGTTRLRSLLLVDDEATLRSALRRYFTRRGWQVIEAEDGERARALLLDGETVGGGFDAVVSDMRMPRLSGMALHDAVAAIDSTVSRRFVFSSGDTGDDEASAFLERTHCPVLSKPFELAALLAVVERIADGLTPSPN